MARQRVFKRGAKAKAAENREEAHAVNVVTAQMAKLDIIKKPRGLSKSKRANILGRGRSHISAALKSSDVSTKLISVHLADNTTRRKTGGKFFVFPLSGHGHIVVVYGARGTKRAAIIAKIFGGSSGSKFAVVRQAKRVYVSKKDGKKKKSSRRVDVMDVIKVVSQQSSRNFKMAHRGFTAEKKGSVSGRNMGAVSYAALKSAGIKRLKTGARDQVIYDMKSGRVLHNKQEMAGFGRGRRSPKGTRKPRSPRKAAAGPRKARKAKSPRYRNLKSTSSNMRRYIAGLKSGSSSRRRILGIPKAPALPQPGHRKPYRSPAARKSTASRRSTRASAAPAAPVAGRRSARLRIAASRR